MSVPCRTTSSSRSRADGILRLARRVEKPVSDRLRAEVELFLNPGETANSTSMDHDDSLKPRADNRRLCPGFRPSIHSPNRRLPPVLRRVRSSAASPIPCALCRVDDVRGILARTLVNGTSCILELHSRPIAYEADDFAHFSAAIGREMIDVPNAAALEDELLAARNVADVDPI